MCSLSDMLHKLIIIIICFPRNSCTSQVTPKNISISLLHNQRGIYSLQGKIEQWKSKHTPLDGCANTEIKYLVSRQFIIREKRVFHLMLAEREKHQRMRENVKNHRRLLSVDVMRRNVYVARMINCRKRWSLEKFITFSRTNEITGNVKREEFLRVV